MKSKGQLSRFGRFSSLPGQGVSDENWARTFGTTAPKPVEGLERGQVRKDYRKQRLVRVKSKTSEENLTKPRE